MHILENARSTINLEVEMIQAMSCRLNQEFVRAVKTILEMQGRIVVIGMGKSGIIGRKIAATLASTGTPAFFVHPGEALHGDLGMIKPVDVAILISNSGETEELIRILPFLKFQENQVIAMTGNSKSILAMHANVVLDTGVDREACTNNLAPTSSTTCTLVMGDALAVALSVERNFQPKDFARFHPGGKLGRQLLMRVSDVMCKTLPLIGLDSSIHDAIVLMTKMRKGVVFITDADEHSIIGIFTDGDLRRAMLNKQFDLNALVKNHMVDNPISIISNATLKEAEALFIDNKVHCLIVIEGSTNAPVGMIELFDL